VRHCHDGEGPAPSGVADMEIIDLRNLKPAHEMGTAARAACLPLLLPLSLIYGGIVWLWRELPARAVDVGVPVVSVGSVLVGGTGKTPLALLVAGGLSQRGLRVCILSRGYLRKGKTSPAMASDGAGAFAPVCEVGDEPYLMARRLPEVGVVVGRDRAAAAREAKAKLAPEVFVLDDGFQYRGVSKSVEILTLDEASLERRQHMLPVGRLREPWARMERGDIFVVLEESGDRASAGKWRGRFPAGRAFAARYGGARVIAPGGVEVAPDALRETRALVLSGIARPAGFERICSLVGVRSEVAVRTGDHHWYSEQDAERLLDLLRRHRCTRVVTTEKDFWKLPQRLMDVSWFVRADLNLDDPRGFWDVLLSRIRGLE
jgi:tetraacyldisaccharide 4'-kinase